MYSVVKYWFTKMVPRLHQEIILEHLCKENMRVFQVVFKILLRAERLSQVSHRIWPQDDHSA